MRLMLLMESGAPGALMVNGQFCGPLEGEGQAFPAGRDAEIYIQLFPFDPACAPLSVALELRGGRIARLEPQAHAFALHWPDGVIELELRPAGMPENAHGAPGRGEPPASGVLLRYLALRLAGDAQAQRLLAPRTDAPDLSAYFSAVPLAHAPCGVREAYDERAGLVRRAAPNVALVDAALAVLAPAGQGQRLIERIHLYPAAEGS